MTFHPLEAQKPAASGSETGSEHLILPEGLTLTQCIAYLHYSIPTKQLLLFRTIWRLWVGPQLLVLVGKILQNIKLGTIQGQVLTHLSSPLVKKHESSKWSLNSIMVTLCIWLSLETSQDLELTKMWPRWTKLASMCLQNSTTPKRLIGLKTLG